MMQSRLCITVDDLDKSAMDVRGAIGKFFDSQQRTEMLGSQVLTSQSHAQSSTGLVKVRFAVEPTAPATSTLANVLEVKKPRTRSGDSCFDGVQVAAQM